jgi:hypothetical protein
MSTPNHNFKTQASNSVLNSEARSASNAYPPQSNNGGSFLVDDSNESWKNLIRNQEAFSCLGRQDGFYASRWCNVFYRCFLGIKTEFLCPKMLNADRLWWVQHGSQQDVPQTSAACVWPCESKKKCQSPGGIIIESAQGKFEESVSEVDRVWRASSCQSETNRLSDMFKLSDTRQEQADANCLGVSEDNFFASDYCNVVCVQFLNFFLSKKMFIFSLMREITYFFCYLLSYCARSKIRGKIRKKNLFLNFSKTAFLSGGKVTAKKYDFQNHTSLN